MLKPIAAIAFVSTALVVLVSCVSGAVTPAVQRSSNEGVPALTSLPTSAPTPAPTPTAIVIGPILPTDSPESPMPGPLLTPLPRHGQERTDAFAPQRFGLPEYIGDGWIVTVRKEGVNAQCVYPSGALVILAIILDGDFNKDMALRQDITHAAAKLGYSNVDIQIQTTNVKPSEVLAAAIHNAENWPIAACTPMPIVEMPAATVTASAPKRADPYAPWRFGLPEEVIPGWHILAVLKQDVNMKCYPFHYQADTVLLVGGRGPAPGSAEFHSFSVKDVWDALRKLVDENDLKAEVSISWSNVPAGEMLPQAIRAADFYNMPAYCSMFAEALKMRKASLMPLSKQWEEWE